MKRRVAYRVRAAMARVSLDGELQAWIRRHEDVRSACKQGVETGRWVPWDVRDAFLEGRKADLPERLQRYGATPMLTERHAESLAFGPEDMESLMDGTNE